MTQKEWEYSMTVHRCERHPTCELIIQIANCYRQHIRIILPYMHMDVYRYFPRKHDRLNNWRSRACAPILPHYIALFRYTVNTYLIKLKTGSELIKYSQREWKFSCSYIYEGIWKERWARFAYTLPIHI